jgi:hypothetical protein
MAEDDADRSAKPQPSPGWPEAVAARVKELAGILRAAVPSPATTEIDRVDAGLFSPPSPPTSPDADQAGGPAKARHPGEHRPATRDGQDVPSVSEILANPKRWHPPMPPGHGPSRGRGMKR